MACEVTRYDCQHHSNTIRNLGRNANAQLARNDGFVSIFPWKKQCADAETHIHYIARSHTGVICGWLTAKPLELFGQHYIYLNEISTRRIKDELYGGVGRRLHDALVRDAREAGVDFIYLYPLNPGVAEIYKGWGYVNPRPELVHMFLILSSPPNNRMLDSIMPPNPRTFIAASHALAMRPPKDEELLALISHTRRYMIKNPDLIRELSSAIDMVEGVEYIEDAEAMPNNERLSLDDKRDIIREVFQKVKVGGRKTRRRTRRSRKN